MGWETTNYKMMVGDEIILSGSHYYTFWEAVLNYLRYRHWQWGSSDGTYKVLSVFPEPTDLPSQE